MKKIDRAIFGHSRLKFHLKNAIETARSDFKYEEIKDPHACPLGEWLDSPEGQVLPNYAELTEIHKDFHKEAAQVLDLALQGKKNEAKLSIQPLTSKFSKLSSQLVNTLAEI